MDLEVLRIISQKDSTNGILFDVTEGKEHSYATLEDEHREGVGETRILMELTKSHSEK